MMAKILAPMVSIVSLMKQGGMVSVGLVAGFCCPMVSKRRETITGSKLLKTLWHVTEMDGSSKRGDIIALMLLINMFHTNYSGLILYVNRDCISPVWASFSKTWQLAAYKK